MSVILATSPHRVFISRLGRIEVCQPIPPHDGRSPQGPHTHVLVDLLKHRRTHAATEPIPDGFVPCAHVYPPHPAKDALGEPRPFDAARHDAFQEMLRTFGDPDQIALKQRVMAAVAAGEKSVGGIDHQQSLCAHQHPRRAAPASRGRTDGAGPGGLDGGARAFESGDDLMDGIHDMGGMHGFGKVEPEPNEPVFHAPWEGRALALNRMMGYAGLWTIDQTRATPSSSFRRCSI